MTRFRMTQKQRVIPNLIRNLEFRRMMLKGMQMLKQVQHDRIKDCVVQDDPRTICHSELDSESGMLKEDAETVTDAETSSA